MANEQEGESADKVKFTLGCSYNLPSNTPHEDALDVFYVFFNVTTHGFRPSAQTVDAYNRYMASRCVEDASFTPLVVCLRWCSQPTKTPA